MMQTFDNKARTSNASNVAIIAENIQKCMTYNFLYVKFIDSCLVLNASLEQLVANLAQSCSSGNFHKFYHTPSLLGDNSLLFSKVIFPYELFDSLSKFEGKQLSPRESLYSFLTEERINDEDYERAQQVWRTFHCKLFKDCHDFYLKTDVTLLANVF